MYNNDATTNRQILEAGSSLDRPRVRNVQKRLPAPKLPAHMKDRKLKYYRIDWKPIKLKTLDIVVIEKPGPEERMLWHPVVQKNGSMLGDVIVK